MEYKVVHSFSSSSGKECCEKLQERVNNLIGCGFKPYGSLQFFFGEKGWMYHAVQAMIKED